MSTEEAKKLVKFHHQCTCGGYAWAINGRPENRPHTTWCPQMQQYNDWWDALHGDRTQ